MQGRSRRIFGRALTLSLGLTASYLFWSRLTTGPSTLQSYSPDRQGRCLRQQVDLSNSLIAKYLKQVDNIICDQQPDWLIVSNGSVWTNPDVGQITCVLDFLKRIDDFKSVVSESIILKSTQSPVLTPRDFFLARCQNENGTNWNNIQAGVRRDPLLKVKSGVRDSKNVKWNVLMFGFDSISRLHFQRKLPRTYSFLKDLGTVVLEGYNIVGDGTPQAMIPILTGFAETELPDTRKRYSASQHVDVYPFVWKNYSARGYVTAYAEDTPSYGIFTYRLKGFKQQPTDHYMRPFYFEAEKVYSQHKRLCMRNVTRHKVMLNWIREVYNVYREIPKFAFGFHGELSHDDFNLVGAADDDLLDFISGLKQNRLLDKTFLIVMSDHGARFSEMRATVQGKLEERLPFVSIAMPAIFKKMFPHLARNLRRNAQRLTTPFDLYPTLLDIMHPESVKIISNGTKRGISLFSEIPQERTCSQAGVDPHWCTCLTWDKIHLHSQTAKAAAQAVVDFVNDLTANWKSSCASLTLANVTRAERYQPNENLLKYKGVLDKDGFVPDFTEKEIRHEVIYQVQFEVHPSGGVYEATVKYDSAARTFHVNEKEISRVNVYGTQPHCVQEQFPHLMKYCYCKKQVT